jgi:cytochrome c biogenesis protein CcdA
MILYILAFIIGLVYGYVKPGKENRWELLKKGALFGVILGIIFGVIGFFVGGLFLFAVTTIGIIIEVIFLIILFILGTFIGDILETTFKKSA